MNVKLLSVSIYIQLIFFVHGCFCRHQFLHKLKWRQNGYHQVKVKDVDVVNVYLPVLLIVRIHVCAVFTGPSC